jgi:hypothetical protein
VYSVGCGAWSSTADPNPLPEQQASTSGLLYQGSGNWQYNWKTPKLYANSCMVARVDALLDGTTHDFDGLVQVGPLAAGERQPLAIPLLRCRPPRPCGRTEIRPYD